MVNKWDLISKDQNTAEKFRKEIEERLGTLSYIPIIFTSVLTKQRVFKAIENAIAVYNERVKKVPTSELNKVLLQEIDKFKPPAYKGKHIKIKYVTQLPTHTPTFAFFCNFPILSYCRCESLLNSVNSARLRRSDSAAFHHKG